MNSYIHSHTFPSILGCYLHLETEVGNMMHFNLNLAALCSLILILELSLAQKLPQVDLGYEVHQAIAFNVQYIPIYFH